jgi:ABC-2 type transport system permease protein
MYQGIWRSIVHSYHIGIKDLRAFTRDRMQMVAFILMPIFMMIMMGFIFPSQNSLKNTPFGIVNEDEGAFGGQIAATLTEIGTGSDSKMFDITTPENEAEAVELIKKQAINGAVIIPADFSSTITSGGQGRLTVITNQSNPQIAQMMSGMLDSIMSEMSYHMAAGQVSILMPEASNPEAVVRPFVMETKGVVPGDPNYFQFMAPGLMAMVIMMAVMTGIAASVSQEREIGTLDGMLSAPTSRLAIILGKSFAQVVRGLLQAGITLLLAVVVFGISINGSPLLLIVLLILTVFSFIGLGMLVSAMASQQQTATTIMMTLTMPMMFLSGAFFPIEQMPTIMQWISRVLPLTYAVDALRKCMVLGTEISGMMTEILVMIGFGVFFMIVAIPVFRRVITR